MVVVYRGKHCPLCTKVSLLNLEMRADFLEAGVDIAVVSADTEEKQKVQTQEKLQLEFEVGYDMSIEQMNELGFISLTPGRLKKPTGPLLSQAFLLL